MIDPETKKYIDDVVGMQNIKMASLISTLFEILEKKNITDPDDWDKALDKSHAMVNLASMFGIQEFTDKVTKQARENEDLR